MSRRVVGAVLGLTLLAAPRAARAQSAASTPRDAAPAAGGPSAVMPAGAWTVGVWMGAAVHSPVHTRLGATGGRDFFTAALRVGHVLAAGRRFAAEYTADLVPIAVVTRNPYYRADRVVLTDGRSLTVFWPTGDGPVYGAGLAPLGMRLHFAAAPRVRLFANVAGGGLWFTRNMPVPSARRFNFTAEAGGGAELASGDRALTVGYKLHHMSNGYTAASNPGLDGHMVYVGVSRLWRRSR